MFMVRELVDMLCLPSTELVQMGLTMLFSPVPFPWNIKQPNSLVGEFLLYRKKIRYGVKINLFQGTNDPPQAPINKHLSMI